MLNIKGIKIYPILSLIAGIIVIVAKFSSDNFLENLSKPFIIIPLVIMLYHNLDTFKKSINLVFLALLFSLFGDIFLMPLVDNFILGLASFLIAHLFYLSYFQKSNKNTWYVKWYTRPTSLVIFTLVLFFLILILYSMMLSNQEIFMMLAVFIYASVISTMLLATWNIYNFKKDKKSLIVAIGASLFVISDSIIASNKFIADIKFDGLYVISTYAIAQILLTSGIIANQSKNSLKQYK